WDGIDDPSNLPLIALVPRFGLLGHRDIGYCPDKLTVARGIPDGMGDDVHIFDEAIRHCEAMIKIQVGPFTGSALEHLAYDRQVFRMDACEQAIQRGLRLAVVSHNAKRFLGPDEFARGDIPAETARPTHALRFREIGLAAPQRLCGPRALNRNHGD